MKEEEIDSLTTDQLRIELQKFGLKSVVLMPSTIKIYKNKLKSLMSSKSGSENEENEEEEEEVNEKENLTKVSHQKTLSSCYYIVYDGIDDFKAPRMFHDHSLMKRFAMTHKARFSTFNSEEEAQTYLTELLNRPVVQRNNVVELTPTSQSSYSNLNQTNLNVLISTLNKGDVDQFDQLVWQNPHYLWSSSNLPVILRPKPRYNALHIAAKAGHACMIAKIIETLQNDLFYEMLQFPKEQKTRFVDHILDAYFNTPDDPLHQTALHFACSSGHVEAVEQLLSYESCKKNVKNKFGKTPVEVIRGNSLTTERIKFILQEKFYIPLVRPSDNSSPAKVQKPVTSGSPLLKNHKSQEGMTDLPILSAIIGPFTEQKEALDTYKKWTSPDMKTLKENRKIVGSDFDRGYERIGREVAKNKLVGWVEHWPFLDQFADLSKPSGLKLLDDYFGKKGLNRDRLEEGEDTTILFSSKKEVLKDNTSDVKNNLGKGYNSTTELTSSFNHLGLGDAPKSEDQLKNSFCKDENRFYITGCNPTKLDLDVFLAIGQTFVDPQLYPHVCRWQDIIKQFSSDEKKKWKTPRKPLKRNINSKISPIPFLI